MSASIRHPAIRSLTLAVTVLLTLVLAAPAAPAAPQTISFGGPREIVAATDLVTFSGTVSGLPPGQEEDFVPYIQGIAGTAQATGTGSYDFAIDVTVGPTPPLAGYDDAFPYAQFYTEPNRLALPIVIELFQTSTGVVVDRRKTFVWDLRGNARTDIAADAANQERLAVQISTRGIDRLEPALISTVPHPSQAAFNERLEANYTTPHQEHELETGYFAADKACLPMQDVAKLFKGTPEFLAAKLLAGVQYGVYQVAQAQGLPTAPFCVKTASFANAKHWEVCVGRLDGDLTKVKLKGGVTKADLETAAGGLEALVNLGRIDQAVDVKLRDVTIRWRDNPFCLTVRPAVAVADATMTADPARDAWATCAATNALAKKAKTLAPIGLPFGENDDAELFDVIDGGAVAFDVPVSARTPQSQIGTCALSFLNPSVNTLLEQYYAPLEQTLADTWLEDSPESQFATAMDLLLSPVEHGTFDEPLDHEITTEFTSFGAERVGGGGGQPVDGIWFRQSTNAAVKDAFALVPAPATFVQPSPMGVVWSDDGLSAHQFPFAFDLAFSTTTGALNQVLRELSATERMRFTIEPLPSGLTFGQFLAAVAPTELAALTSPTLEWRVSPRIAPFTWMMMTDPPGVPSGRVPMAYQVLDLRVDAIEPGVGGASDTRLLQLKLDFLDPHLTLAFSETLGEKFLIPSLSQPLFVATVAENDLGTCPMKPHVKGNEATCDRLVELAATLGLRPLVLDMMTDLLSDYPAPQFFDAQGEALAPFQVENIDRYFLDNRIILYAEIPQ